MARDSRGLRELDLGSSAAVIVLVLLEFAEERARGWRRSAPVMIEPRAVDMWLCLTGCLRDRDEALCNVNFAGKLAAGTK